MDKKKRRYERIFKQLSELLTATENPISRMATMAAENLLAALRGEHPPNAVNPEAVS